MGSCAAPSAKGDDKFITTDYLQQCPRERQAHEAGARTRATAHERTPQQERQKAAREAERGREAWTLGQGMKKPVAGCYGRLTRWKGGGDVVYMALL